MLNSNPPKIDNPNWTCTGGVAPPKIHWLPRILGENGFQSSGSGSFMTPTRSLRIVLERLANWVQAIFRSPVVHGEVELFFFFDDQPSSHGCKVPGSWGRIYSMGLSQLQNVWISFPNRKQLNSFDERKTNNPQKVRNINLLSCLFIWRTICESNPTIMGYRHISSAHAMFKGNYLWLVSCCLWPLTCRWQSVPRASWAIPRRVAKNTFEPLDLGRSSIKIYTP